MGTGHSRPVTPPLAPCWLVGCFFWASIYGRYPTSIPNGPKWVPLSAAAAAADSSWWFTRTLSEGHPPPPPPPPPPSLILNLSFPSRRIGRSSPQSPSFTCVSRSVTSTPPSLRPPHSAPSAVYKPVSPPLLLRLRRRHSP